MGLRASFNDAYVQSTSSDNARRYATSWLLPTRTLGVIRAMLALYGFVVSFTVIGVLNSWGGSWLAGGNFGYFTTLSYWALNCYFVVAAIYSLHWSRVSRHGRDAGERDTLLSRLPAPLIFAHASLYATLAVFAPLITIIFWGILARVHGANATGYPFATFSNVSQHALNSVAAAFEIVATDAPVPSWLCLGPIILVLALYLCLTAVFKAARGYAVYPFLDQANGSGLVAGAIVGILAAAIVVFVVVRYLIVLRDKLTDSRRRRRSPSYDDRGQVGHEVLLVRASKR